MKSGLKIDLIVVDGELLIHPLPYNTPVDNGVLRPVIHVIDEMIKLAKETKTAIVGVVKRTRSKYLSIFLNKCLPVNDKLITSLILKENEFLHIGKFSEILPKWIEINYTQCEKLKRCKDKCSEDVEELLNMRLIEGRKNLEKVFSGEYGKFEGIQYIKDIEVVYYKAKNAITSTKVEILNFSNYSTSEIISILANLSTHTGYPFILDRVDEFVRVDSRVLDYVRQQIIKQSSLLNKDLVNMYLTLTNLQKQYLYRPLDVY